MQYRRNFAEGGRYFFTVNLAERKRYLLVEHIDALRAAIRIVRSRHPFQIDAMVVMPDHLHAVFTLPPGDADYPTRWMLIKAGFSRNIPKTERINASRRSKGERGIWQRRFWEHTLQDENDFRHHIDYIHYNPVKHGYVTRSTDWPHSRIHRFIKTGTLPADWGAASPENDKRFGKRRLG
ncbi:MAG: transposase [Nitrosomonas sp.]|nr:transposase [Nitrosomonas sp.]